jgi:predicted phage terminase large subunit-like protein
VQSYAPAEAQHFDRTIQSWDTAGKTGQHNDFSACSTWGLKGARAHLRDVYREKLEFPDLKARVIDLALRWNAERVLVEDQSSGIALIQELKSADFYKAFPIKPKGDKVQRLLGVTPMFESGQVLLPHSAPWLDAYLHELCAFPLGRNDDQVDSTTQALAWIREFGAEPALITHYRQEAERERAYREDKTVRMLAPEGPSHWGLMDGTMVSIPPDRIVLMTAENARPLRGSGWTEVPAP